jgi:hypothetical protein
MVNPSSCHVLGECKPQEVVILVLFFCTSTPRGQLELIMAPAACIKADGDAFMKTYVAREHLCHVEIAGTFRPWASFTEAR